MKGQIMIKAKRWVLDDFSPEGRFPNAPSVFWEPERPVCTNQSWHDQVDVAAAGFSS